MANSTHYVVAESVELRSCPLRPQAAVVCLHDLLLFSFNSELRATTQPMQLRLPWILSRRRLLAAVFLDSALFMALYNGLFLQRFGRWPEGSILLPVLWAMWVLSSYVMGRYQGVDGVRSPTASFMALQGVVKTTLVVWLQPCRNADLPLAVQNQCRRLPVSWLSDSVSRFSWTG